MSTLKVAAINNPSAGSGGLAISTTGNVTGTGLDLIASQSFSAASSVSVNNCFTSQYENYLIVSAYTAASGTPDFLLRLRASGVDDTSANYSFQFRYGSSTTIAGSRTPGSTFSGAGWSSTGQNFLRFDLLKPALATPTTGISFSLRSNVTTPETVDYTLAHNVSAAYDGFTLYPASSTVTGSVRVYGYRN